MDSTHKQALEELAEWMEKYEYRIEIEFDTSGRCPGISVGDYVDSTALPNYCDAEYIRELLKEGMNSNKTELVVSRVKEYLVRTKQSYGEFLDQLLVCNRLLEAEKQNVALVELCNQVITDYENETRPRGTDTTVYPQYRLKLKQIIGEE